MLRASVIVVLLLVSLAAAGWIAPGETVMSGCGERAGGTAAFYCPGDDTIYVAQELAADLYAGVARGLPGQSAGYGRAAGDFAVAYVVAHEYAHNLQQELGIFDGMVANTAKPFELQADCLAGVWAYSVYAAGELEPGDLEEAANAAAGPGGGPSAAGRRRARRAGAERGVDVVGRSATSSSAPPSTTARPLSAARRC